MLVKKSVPDGEVEGSAGAPSYTESALSESIPTTPDVQLDHPNFPGASLPEPPRRKLSHDSGACELEEQLACLDEPLDDDLCLAANVLDPNVYANKACAIKTEAS